MRLASAARSGGQRLLALCAVISMLLSLMAIGAGPALGDAPASGPDTITVDGVTYQATQKSGPVSHFETPDTNPTAAATSRNVWEGHGSEHLPCENGIHWVDNTELLTISNCLEGDGEPEPEPEPELELATASVDGACVEGSFVVIVNTLNSTLRVDLDGDGSIETSETGLTTGSFDVTAAVGATIRFRAIADTGAEFEGEAPSGTITVLDCVVEEGPDVGTLQIKKHAADDPEAVFTFTGPDGTFTLKHGESFFFEAELGVEFTFTEIVPEGWRLEDIDCDDPDGTAVIDLENNSVTMVVTDPGSPFKCDFDNEEGVFEQPDTGTLQIKKHAADDPEAVFTFTGPDGTFTLKHGESFFFEAELGVEFTFTEIVPEGWRLEDIDCDDPDGTAVIDLENNSVTMVVTDPGSPFKCDFDNEQEAAVPEGEVGNIVIEKEVTEGSDQETEFNFEATGFALADATLAHGEQISVEVNAGVFSVAELSAEGWELVSAVCESTDEGDESTPEAISISADETVICTFTNAEVEVSPEALPEIAVTKTPDLSAASPGDVVTFTVVISNPSATEPVKISSIVDSVFGTLSGDADCMVDVTLAAGASCEFTFTWTVTEADIGTHENVVEVIGIDVEKPEVTVEAEAKAVVEVTEVGGIVITPPEQPGPITPVDRPDVAPDVEVGAEQLPFTGIESDILVGLAIMLLGSGVLLLRWAPPREIDIIIEK